MSTAPLHINATNETPGVHFDAGANRLEIIGKSLPENATGFYEPLLHWMQSYVQQPNEETQLVMELEYFNTATSKPIVQLLELLGDIHQQGHKVTVVWRFSEDDEDIEDAGLELSEIVQVPFKFEAMEV